MQKGNVVQVKPGKVSFVIDDFVDKVSEAASIQCGRACDSDDVIDGAVIRAVS